jgi:hypothetical protein
LDKVSVTLGEVKVYSMDENQQPSVSDVKFTYLSKTCTVLLSEELHEINIAKDVKTG